MPKKIFFEPLSLDYVEEILTRKRSPNDCLSMEEWKEISEVMMIGYNQMKERVQMDKRFIVIDSDEGSYTIYDSTNYTMFIVEI